MEPGVEGAVGQGSRRRAVLLGLHQPLTVRQLSRRIGLSLGMCSATLGELSALRLVRCLNPRAQRARVYWLTKAGLHHRRLLREAAGHPRETSRVPVADWDLYGLLCFRHRSAVVAALTEPMRPPAIKKRALQRDPSLRISTGNIRELLPFLVSRGVVRKAKAHGEQHPHYALTPAGEAIRVLLVGAERPMPGALPADSWGVS